MSDNKKCIAIFPIDLENVTKKISLGQHYVALDDIIFSLTKQDDNTPDSFKNVNVLIVNNIFDNKELQNYVNYKYANEVKVCKFTEYNLLKKVFKIIIFCSLKPEAHISNVNNLDNKFVAFIMASSKVKDFKDKLINRINDKKISNIAGIIINNTVVYVNSEGNIK